MNKTAVDERVIISAAISERVRAELTRRARAADRTLSGEVPRALANYLERADHQEETAHRGSPAVRNSPRTTGTATSPAASRSRPTRTAPASSTTATSPGPNA